MNNYNGNDIIINGEIINKNIRSYGMNQRIIDELNHQHIKLDDIQYAEIQLDGNLYIETKNHNINTFHLI